MGYIIGVLFIGIIGGSMIWLTSKRKKYVIIFLIIILLLLVLPWVLLFLAFSNGAEFPG